MKNLEKLYQNCCEMCGNLSIPYAKDTPISWNGRITKKWGYSRKHSDGTFSISISSALRESDIPDNALISVILHELLHTCPGCFDHGKQWKKYGKMIKDAYGIKIRTTSDAYDMGIPQRYYIKCRRCEIKIPYAIKPRNTKRTCPVCKSKRLTCFYKDERGKQKIWKR